MINKKKIFYEILFMCFIGFIISVTYTNQIKNSIVDNTNTQTIENIEKISFLNLPGTPIIIDDLDPLLNWNETAYNYEWCSGNGTWGNPYIIENIAIDAENSGSAISISNSINNYFIIRNCTLINSGSSTYDAGLKLYNSSHGIIELNNCSQNLQNGLLLQANSDNNTIINNNFTQNSYGIYVYSGSDNNTIINNTITDHNRGIFLSSNDDNLIQNNTILNSDFYGIYVLNSDRNQFKNNTIKGISGRDGIYISDSNYNNFTDNIIQDCNLFYHAIRVLTSDHNRFVGNSLNNSDFFLSSDLLSDHLTSVLKNNTYNGKPILFMVNEKNLDSSNFSNAAQVILINCTNIDIKDMNISTSFSENKPIQFLFCDTFNISNNWIKDKVYGSYLTSCTNGNIKNNTIDYTDAGTQFGIYLTDYCKYITVENNTINNYYYGIYIINYCDNNSIINNTISYSFEAIRLSNNCNYNNITNHNNIFHIDYCISVRASSNNYIFNNNITQSFKNGIKIEGSSFYNDIIKNYISGASIEGITIGENGADSDFNNIINNTVIYCTNYGIHLTNADNNEIIGNNMSYNSERGIQFDESFGTCLNNIISFNTMNFNEDDGIFLDRSSGTQVFNNTCKGNKNQGITISKGGLSTKIFNNTISFSTEVGVSAGIGVYEDSSIVSENRIFNCTDGIRLSSVSNCNIIMNVISNCTNYGIIITASTTAQNNVIMENIIKNNTLGLYIYNAVFVQDNFVYLNQFLSNDLQAQDDCGVFDNNWDNGSIGNYWDDYGSIGGVDLNDDGIGDDPYNIIGGPSDNYPIWDDGDSIAPKITINSPINGSYSNLPPTINLTYFDINNDSLWYEFAGINYTLQNNTNQQLNPGDWNNLGQGFYIIYLFANDTAGNLNESLVLRLYKDTEAPQITISSPQNGSEFSSTPILNIVVSDPNIDSMWYEFQGQEYNFTSGVNEQLDSDVWDNLALGEYHIYIYANDTYGYMTTPVVLTIYKVEQYEPLPFDRLLLIIILTIIGIISVFAIAILIAFQRTRGKKKTQKLDIKTKWKTTPEIKNKPPVKIPKLKDTIHKEKLVSKEELTAIQAETQKTQEEMNIEKEIDICIVHKGPIDGLIYSCPKCGVKYCTRCINALKIKKEGCWACGESIKL